VAAFFSHAGYASREHPFVADYLSIVLKTYFIVYSMVDSDKQTANDIGVCLFQMF